MVWARLNSMAARSGILSERQRRTVRSPVVPHGFQALRQRRKRSEIGMALGLAVEIGAARGEESEFARASRELVVLLRRVGAGHDLDARAAAIPELREEFPHLGPFVFVASGMRDDGDAAGRAYPAHGVLERRPLVRDPARPVLHQIALEDMLHVGRAAGLDEEASE